MAFFSGTDLSTLQSEGNEKNCFVSLIVNNAGTYCAAITRKVQTKSEVTVKNLGQSYEFFGDGEVSLEGGEQTVTKTIDSEVIEYYKLEIEKEEVENPLEYLDKRFDDIQNKKKEKVFASPTHRYFKDVNPDITKQEETTDTEFYDWLHGKKSEPKQLTLFEYDFPEAEEEEKMFQWSPKPELVQKAVIKIVTCSLIINPYKFNLEQWVERHMETRYKDIFGEDNDGLLTDAFDKWKEFAIDFYIDTLADETIPKDYDYNDFQAVAAAALQDEISQYYNYNIYMQAYYDLLTDYIC